MHFRLDFIYFRSLFIAFLVIIPPKILIERIKMTDLTTPKRYSVPYNIHFSTFHLPF